MKKLFCEDCGFVAQPLILEKHHIIPRCYGGSNDKKNLVVLCPNCHKIWHLKLNEYVNRTPSNEIDLKHYLEVQRYALSVKEYQRIKISSWLIENNDFITKFNTEKELADEREFALANLDNTIKSVKENLKLIMNKKEKPSVEEESSIDSNDELPKVEDKDRRECS
jgi:hypothetical protein